MKGSFVALILLQYDLGSEKSVVAVLFQQHPPQLADPGFMSDGSNDKNQGQQKRPIKISAEKQSPIV